MYQPAPVPHSLTMILTVLSHDDARRVEYAFQFAAAAHAGQIRDEGTPFIDHPVSVASILCNELGSRDVDVVLAALCHDVLEDCVELDESVLRGVIGERGTELVLAVTKPSVPDDQKAARDRIYLDCIRRADYDVRLVKLADRIHNLRSIPNSGDPAKARRYLEVSRREFLPIAAATDLTAERLVASACDDIERYLATVNT